MAGLGSAGQGKDIFKQPNLVRPGRARRGVAGLGAAWPGEAWFFDLYLKFIEKDFLSDYSG